MSPGVAPASRKWAVLAAVGSSYFITVLTVTLSILALPSIAEDFDITLRTVGWVVIVESLVIAALVLPFGRLSDLYGRNRALRVGIAVFGAGLVVTGLSPTFTLLIVARIVTAIGNTLVQSVSTGILVAAFPPEQRGLALGGQTTAVALGAAIGPLLGGLLLDELDWKLLFIFLAIPTALIFTLVNFVLDQDPPVAGVPEGSIDASGALLAAAFITLLVFTLNDPFEFGLASAPTMAGAGAAAAALAMFIRAERAHEQPMLDVELFAIPSFRRAVLIRGVSFIASASIMFLVPIYLLGVRELSTRSAGAVIAVFAVGMTIGAQVSGRAYDRVGPRVPIVGGLVIQVIALGALTAVGETSSITIVAAATFANGLGQGLWNVPANSMMMGAMPTDALGVGGAFSNVTRTVGSVVGQAGATAIVAGVMSSNGFDIPLADVAENVGARSAFIDGWRATFMIGVIVTASAMFVAGRANDAPPLPAATETRGRMLP